MVLLTLKIGYRDLLEQIYQLLWSMGAEFTLSHSLIMQSRKFCVSLRRYCSYYA